MKLIIGLGNPGTKYLKNRHNVGHMFIDFLQGEILRTQDLSFQKTNIFMNESGVFVKNVSRTYNLEPSHLYIVHDDLDIKLGEYKIQFGKGPQLHYGIQSVENELGTKDFWRIRIGVDDRPTSPEATRARGEDYVLQDFLPEELKILDGVFHEIYKELINKV